MKTRLYKHIIRLTALLLVLSLIPSGLGLAVSDRPEVAVPFEDELTSEAGSQITLSFDNVMALTSVNVFQNGGDRLATLQNTDGGWDWPLNDGNAASPSPKNTVAPIGQGLALAYDYSGDPDHLATLQDAGTFLLAKTNNFSPSDGYLAATLDEIFGVTIYKDHVVNNFYDPLASSTYNRNGAGTLYSTMSYVNLIRTSRSGSQANLAAWDIGMGLVGAAMVGADTAPWIAGLKAEIDELDSSNYYDVIGLAGAIYGLAYVGEDYSPSAGAHDTATSLADLGIILSSYKISSGGFAWNSGVVTLGEEAIQETSYAILALDELDRTTHLGTILDAADYIESVQLGTGGWQQYPSYSSGENNEITGEALWGIYAAYPYNEAPVAEANGPYMVAVGQSVALDHTGSSDPDGDPLTYNWAVTGEALGTVTMETFTAGTAAGITEVTLTVDDGFGGTATDTAMVVVYDPTGGFVTGGGWIDSPAGALGQTTAYFNGFETDIEGWFTPTRVMSGSNGIPSASGGYHAEAIAGNFTRWGGYNSIFPVGGFVTAVDVYLDMDAGFANDTRFDWSSAINDPAGAHRRDFIFTGGFYNDSTGPGAGLNRFVFSASNNSPGWPKNPDRDPFAVTATGWYTLQHRFYDSGSGILAVDMSILDAAGNVLHTWTLSDPSDVIGTTIGGNRYGWLVTNGFPFLAIDNSVRKEASTVTGKATFGFVSKYKKGATVPDGNTEFKFVAGNLNFSSTSYQWLVVNQGGTNAQFKGYGTINGAGNYGFMLWATDGSPDKFRIKIWEEVNGTEVVVYDNGTDQPIGGGSIVVHKK